MSSSSHSLAGRNDDWLAVRPGTDLRRRVVRDRRELPDVRLAADALELPVLNNP